MKPTDYFELVKPHIIKGLNYVSYELNKIPQEYKILEITFNKKELKEFEELCKKHLQELNK